MSSSAEITTMPEMCPHILDAGHTDLAMALISDGAASIYVCPSCFAAQIESRLIDGATAEQITGAVSFRHCGHNGTAPCEYCHAASVAALTGSWAALVLIGEMDTAALLKSTIYELNNSRTAIRLPGNRWTPRLPHVSLRVKLAKDEKAGRTRPAIKSTPAWPVVVVSRPQAAVA